MTASLADRLAQERRARLAAERLLEQKKRELFAANETLALHARALSEQIVQQRHGLQRALTEAESLKGENSRVRGDLERATSVALIAQRRLWDAVETIEDGFAVFDRDLRLVVANRAYLSFFRGEVALAAGVAYEAVVKVVATHHMIDLEGRDPLDWHHEMVARVRCERITPMIVRTHRGHHLKLIDRWGEGGDLVCVVQDITRTIAREAELETARQRAETASRAKSAFLANMGHELRTPMNGVVGMAELLVDSDLSDEQRLYAETIRSSGEALLTIINDVLDFSKIEAERLKLFPEVFDLERCIHEIMMLLQPSAKERGIELLVDYDLFLPTRFRADPGRVRQILTNLIGNAVKFTATGHVLIRVVGLERADGEYDLHLTVEDTGIGIAPENIEHIFGEFNQVDTATNRRFEGTGLGLAITRELVRLMGGTVWVESELGRGSCFGVRFTVPRAEPGDPIEGAGPTQPITLRAALVIDDSLVNRMILERQLQTYGLEVTLCRTGAEALRAFDEGIAFDIVLTDHRMPDIDGIELIRRLRERGIDTPILLLTSDAEAFRAAQADCRGIDWLEKPVLRAELFHMLQKLSGRAPPEPAVAAVATTGAEDAGARPMRVLSVEDNRTNQLVFGKMVKDLDIELRFATNGREAVEVWRRFRPDLIFMDISMPEMDGREATRLIRAEEPAGRHVPICALTAHAMEGDSASMFAAGLDAYLTKPLKKSAIIEQMQAYQPPDTRPFQPPAAG